MKAESGAHSSLAKRVLAVAFVGLTLPGAYAQGERAAAAPAPVIKRLAEIAIYPERTSSAQVVSLNESRIAAEIAGRILAIPVRVGERLARGAVLVQLDCKDHELDRARALAAVKSINSRLALSQQQLKRARELGAQGFFSKEALAARETEVQVLRAENEQAAVLVSAAERAVGKCVLRTPFPAVVRERLGQVGELAAPGSPLVVISDTASIEVSTQVPLERVESLRQARAPRFVGDGGSRPLALLRISPAMDPKARQVEARLRFTAEAAAAGASGAVHWRDAQAHIPFELILRRDGRLGVFVSEQGVARFHPLKDAQEGRPAPTELDAEARIVVSGQLGLSEGQALPAATR